MTHTSVREEKRRLWQRHIQTMRRSGLSAAAYCRLHGLPYKNYVYWKRVLPEFAVETEDGPVLESDFEEITSIVPHEQPPGMFTGPIAAPLRVEVGGRFCIEVAGDFSPVVFAKVVRTLEAMR